MYDFQMKFILILNYKDDSELSDDWVRDTAQTVYKNKINQMRRISTEFMHEKWLTRITRSLFFMRQKIRMKKWIRKSIFSFSQWWNQIFMNLFLKRTMILNIQKLQQQDEKKTWNSILFKYIQIIRSLIN